MTLAEKLREVADALEQDRFGPAELLLIGRLPDGAIISEDSQLTCQSAAALAADFCIDLAQKERKYYRQFYPRGNRRPRCREPR